MWRILDALSLGLPLGSLTGLGAYGVGAFTLLPRRMQHAYLCQG